MKNISLLLLFLLVLSSTKAQNKVYNLECINNTIAEITQKEIVNINEFAQSGKVMVLPFYSDAKGATLSYPLAMELKESLQKAAQNHGFSLTFNYLNEYNKEGNQEINHPPLDSDFDWDAYAKKFEHNFYIEGHYVVDKADDGSQQLVLKNINLKPNDITGKSARKLALANASAQVTATDIAEVLGDAKKTAKVFIKAKEDFGEGETDVLKSEIETQLNDQGYLVTTSQEEAKFIVDTRVSSSRTNAPFPGSFFNWVDIKITIKKAGSTSPLYSKTLDSKKGSSNVSFKHAATTILKKVAAEVSQENILKIIEDDLTNNIW